MNQSRRLVAFACAVCGRAGRRPAYELARVKAPVCGPRCRGQLGARGRPAPLIGQTKIVDGYVLVYVGHDHAEADAHGYARVHRLAMIWRLGRWLDPDEVVSHVDGVRSNNDDGNLFVRRIRRRTG